MSGVDRKDKPLAWLHGEVKTPPFSLAEGDGVLSDPLALTIEDESAEGEQRFVALGINSFGTLMVVVITDRDGEPRLISVRKATPRERRIYEKGI